MSTRFSWIKIYLVFLSADPQDKEFELDEDSEPVDEEDTISDEEAQEGEQQQSEDALMEEADLPIEELLKRYSGYEETVLAAAEGPSVNKRRRTMSRNPDFEYEIEKKKKRDDDCRLTSLEFVGKIFYIFFVSLAFQ